MDTVSITNVRIIDPETGYDETGTITIIDGRIADIGPQARILSDRMDGAGLTAIPGLIDMRVSTGEPGFESRETLESASAAAVAGGVTTCVVMPDTHPVIDDVSLVNFISSQSAGLPVNMLVAAAITKNLAGEALTEIGLLQSAGAVMYTNGPSPICDSQLFRQILSYAGGLDGLVASRPKDVYLSQNTCVHESDFSVRLGLRGSTREAETIMVSRDAILSQLTRCRLLIDMVSAKDSLDLIKHYKTSGAPLFASVSINHLALNELDIGDYRTFAKLDPPLRDETDRLAMLEAVNTGVIDVIVSGHDPRPAGEKRLPFSEAAPGAVGLEVLLSAGLTQVAEGKLDFMAFLKAVTINPAKLLGLESGRIQIGAPGDIVLIDPNKPWQCQAEHLLSKSKNTPFDGRRMTGRAIKTITGGKLVHAMA